MKSEEKSEFGGGWFSCLSAFDESVKLNPILGGKGGGASEAPLRFVVCHCQMAVCRELNLSDFLMDIHCRHPVNFLLKVRSADPP